MSKNDQIVALQFIQLTAVLVMALQEIIEFRVQLNKDNSDKLVLL